MMDLGSAADWVSGLGSLLASGVALHLAGAERRARRESERPEISVETQLPDEERWMQISVKILNVGYKEWQLNKVTILHPSNGLIVHDSKTIAEDVPDWQAGFSKEARNKNAKREVQLRSVVRSMGTPSFTGRGSSDSAWERFHIFIGAGSTMLSLKLHFSSLGPVPDTFTIRVKRRLDQSA